MEALQWCYRCGQDVPVSGFTPSYRGKRGKPCRPCSNAATRAYGRARERALQQLRDRHPDEYRQLYESAAALELGGGYRPGSTRPVN